MERLLFFCIKRMKLQRNTSFGIAAILLFAGITNLKAQTAPSVKMGVRVSPNFSWMNIQEGPMSNDGLGLGFSYGVTADFAMFKSTNYWMGTELSVSTIPVNVKSNSELRNKVTVALPTGGTRDSIYKYPNGKVDFKYNIQYLQIPLTVKMKTDEIGNMKYYFQFGVAPSFAMKKKLSTTTLDSDPIYPNNKGISFHDPNKTDDDVYQFSGTQIVGSPSGETEYDFSDNINTVRFPVVIGAGIEYKLTGSTMFHAGLRFDNSISDFFKDTRVSGRSNMIGLSAGILF
jgi:hypothetical protein